MKDAADQGQIDATVSTVLVAYTIRNAYLGLLQRWVTQQVTDQQFRLETEATVSMMLAGIAKNPLTENTGTISSSERRQGCSMPTHWITLLMPA